MSAATTESIEQRMDRLRHECRVNETGEHTCMADPEVEAPYATWVAEHSHPASAAHAVATEDHDTPGGRAAGDLAWSKRVTAGTAERRLADQRGIELCDYCGEPGCRWQNHGEARDDVAAWNAGTLPGVLYDHG